MKSSQKRTILLIDDSELSNMINKKRLEKAGYSVLTAQNSQEFISILREIKPSLIVLDIMMPEMDGLTALKIFKIASDVKNIPVIAFSHAERSETIVKRMIGLGAFYLSKLEGEVGGLEQVVERHIN